MEFIQNKTKTFFCRSEIINLQFQIDFDTLKATKLLSQIQRVVSKFILPELIGGTEKHGYKVSYDEMISVLFEAIKEQELILDVKESELTELENKFKRNQ